MTTAQILAEMTAAHAVRVDYRRVADWWWQEADEFMTAGFWARAKECWDAALLLEAALFAETHDPEVPE